MTKTMNYDGLLERLSISGIVTLISAVMILLLMAVNGDQKLKLLEETLIQGNSSLVCERIPVKDCMKHYIDTLPIPEQEVLDETEEVESVTIAVEKASARVEEVEAERTGYTVCEDEVLLLARLMHAEEGVLRVKLPYEDAKKAHMLCGSVALNRLNMHYLGDTTITEVIYAPGQYECIKNLNQAVPEETIEWARELIENGPIGPSNMIYQAEFEQGSSTYAHIGNQYFCCR